MSIYYNKKINAICFDKQKIKEIFEDIPRRRIAEIFINGDFENVDDILDNVSMIEDQDDIEIFVSAYAVSDFFGDNVKICLPLKDSIKIDESKISNLDYIKSILNKNTDVDFGVIDSSNDYREFQLKSYRGDGNVSDFIKNLKEVISHYGDVNVNLLFNLQRGGILEEDFFHKVHKEINSLNLKGEGHILIMYNHNMEKTVLNTVYPELSSSETPCIVNN